MSDNNDGFRAVAIVHVDNDGVCDLLVYDCHVSSLGLPFYVKHSDCRMYMATFLAV